jgi:hypothetical protein
VEACRLDHGVDSVFLAGGLAFFEGLKFCLRLAFQFWRLGRVGIFGRVAQPFPIVCRRYPILPGFWEGSGSRPFFLARRGRRGSAQFLA